MNDEQKPPQNEIVGLSAEKRLFWRKWSKRKRLIVVALMLLVVAAVVAAVVWFVIYVTQEPEKPAVKQEVTTQAVCGKDIIVQASPAIDDNDLTAQAAIVEKIRQRDGYQDDINCGYILARYYISTGQADEARATLGQVENQSAVGQVFSLDFLPAALSVESLRGLVEVVEENSKQENQMTPIQLPPSTEVDG